MVIQVLNENTGAFGDIIRWCIAEIPRANPELPVSFLDINKYDIIHEELFIATLECPSFDGMAEYFLTLLIDTEGTENNKVKRKKKLWKQLIRDRYI